MELVIRVVLMFFFIQFLVVMTIMTLALLRAQPEVPILGPVPGARTLKQSMVFALDLPARAVRSITRRVRSMHFHGEL